MLQPVEVLPGARRSPRRAVKLEAEVISYAWDAPRRHRVLDLSPEGIRLVTDSPRPKDEIVVVSFSPPAWSGSELNVFSRVVRSEPRRGDLPATMGLEFLDLPDAAHEAVAKSLRGLPPPLPIGRLAAARELVWVDMLVTYTEDLGDRVNTIEVSEVIKSVEMDQLKVEALGSLLTGPRTPYRWGRAA